jgi:hypothetical protein
LGRKHHQLFAFKGIWGNFHLWTRYADRYGVASYSDFGYAMSVTKPLLTEMWAPEHGGIPPGYLLRRIIYLHPEIQTMQHDGATFD